VPNAKFQNYEQLAKVFEDRYQSLLDQTYPNSGAQAKVFISPNPGTKSSGMTANIGDRVFEVDNAKYGRPIDVDPALLDLQTAWNAAPEIVKTLPVAKALQREREIQREKNNLP